jgi:hypothetical protein
MASRKRKQEAILARIRAGNGATSWSDVQSLLLSVGAERHEREGSRVVFVLGDHVLHAHQVHARRDCGAALISRVRAFLLKAGVL